MLQFIQCQLQKKTSSYTTAFTTKPKIETASQWPWWMICLVWQITKNQAYTVHYLTFSVHLLILQTLVTNIWDTCMLAEGSSLLGFHSHGPCFQKLFQWLQEFIRLVFPSHDYPTFNWSWTFKLGAFPPSLLVSHLKLYGWWTALASWILLVVSELGKDRLQVLSAVPIILSSLLSK